jgi:hypothetical protein
MTSVPVAGLDDLNDVEDVALLVALSESFSFEPVRLAEAAPAARRVGPSLAPARRFIWVLQAAIGRMVTAVLTAPRTAVGAVRSRVRMPRRRRVRRYAVQPIILEGPRRVPVEVLHLSRPSCD